jgi:hypothetical protein
LFFTAGVLALVPAFSSPTVTRRIPPSLLLASLSPRAACRSPLCSRANPQKIQNAERVLTRRSHRGQDIRMRSPHAWQKRARFGFFVWQ